MVWVDLRGEIIGAAIEVHRRLGPGLPESAYEACLSQELALRGVPFRRQQPLPVSYQGVELDCGYRMDLVVGDEVVVEIKAVEALRPLHEAQLLSYLRLGGWKTGLLINFHVPVLRDGLRRLVLSGDDHGRQGGH